VLKPLGADTDGSQLLDPDGRFSNHIPNPENPVAMKYICDKVKEVKADFGIIFDTDVDRAGAVDDLGEEINRNKLIALISAICWGFYSLFVTIIIKKGYNTIGITRKIFFYALIFMIPLMTCGIFAKNPESATYVELDGNLNKIRFASLLNWALLCFLGILASGMCFVAWNKACTILGTVKISSGLYLIPVVTIFFAAIFLKEKITLMGGIGSLLTILGLFVSSKKSKEKKL
jgi:drug/metabolite transporter (DMT)-like permease